MSTRGFAVAGLAAAVLSTMALSPASAKQDIDAELYFPEVLLASGSEGDTERLIIYSDGPAVVKNFTIKIDFAGLAGVATVEPVNRNSSQCPVVGTVLTCVEFADLNLYGGALGVLPDFKFKPVAGAANGDSGTFKVTASGVGLNPSTTDSKVTIGNGVDLAAAPDDIKITAAPGADISTLLGVANAGQNPASGAALWIAADYGFKSTQQHSNCFYREGLITGCVFGGTLAPGKTYVTSQKLALSLLPDTAAPGEDWLEFRWLTVAEFDHLLEQPGMQEWMGEPGTGSELTLVEEVSPSAFGDVDTNDGNNWGLITVEKTGTNKSDTAGIGANGSGAVGSVVSLSVGVKNVGPASVDHGRLGSSGGAFIVRLPQGTSLAEIPEDCGTYKDNGEYDPDNLAARTLLCHTDSAVLLAGSQFTTTLKLKITEVVAGATGEVRAVHPEAPFEEEGDQYLDDNPANNKATIVINAPAGLPVTGAKVGLIVGVGVLLLVAGAALFVLTRRRRIVA